MGPLCIANRVSLTNELTSRVVLPPPLHCTDGQVALIGTKLGTVQKNRYRARRNLISDCTHVKMQTPSQQQPEQQAKPSREINAISGVLGAFVQTSVSTALSETDPLSSIIVASGWFASGSCLSVCVCEMQCTAASLPFYSIHCAHLIIESIALSHHSTLRLIGLPNWWQVMYADTDPLVRLCHRY